ncbi:MAG TPA: hypothetical protein VN636_03445, partial [Acidimicrobiia bacterium]|nr:hypothetical protein [Acidimicrobiia bacterium]
LDQRFRLLTGGSRTARERHQTLRAAIDWSYEMLDAGERRLLGRLAVFVGDFDLDAAVALAAGADLEEFRAVDALGGLVAKSLVERNEAGGTTRYRLLEMIRQYAAEHLDADGDADDARDEHSRYYLNRTAELFAQLSTPDDFAAIDALQAETPNLAAAGRWLVDARRAAELLAFFARVNWIDYGSLPFVAVEDLGRLGRAAADTPGASRRPGFAEACYAAGMQAFYAGDLDGFRHFAELADTAPGERPACTTIGLAGSLSMHGDLSAAVPIAQAAVDHARHRRDRVSLAFLLGALASFEAATMDSAASVPHAREAVEIARATGAQSGLVFALYALANAQRYTEPDRALAVAEECVRIDRTQRRTWSNACRSAAAAVYIEQGDLGRALDLCRAGLQHFHWIGDRTQISVQLAVISEALAPVDASLAVQLAAIGESGAIAAYPFIDNPMMKNLAGGIEELGRDALEAERARAATMSYDDAIAFVFETLDGFTTRAAGP